MTQIIKIISLAILFVSCNYKKGDFTVHAPKGWIKKDSIVNGSKQVNMFAFPTTTPQFVENIRISIYKYWSASSYAKNVLASLKNSSDFFEEVGKGDYKNERFTAQWEQHVCMGKKSDQKFEQRVYFIEKSGNIYMIVCSAKKDEIFYLEKEIKEVLDSLQII